MVPLETLHAIRFLQDLPERELRQIASIAELKEVPARTAIFREGQVCPCIYLVVQGNVGLEINVPGRGPTQFQTIGPGELLGWTPLLGHGPMTATARALTPTQLVLINAAQVQALCAHDPRFGYEFLRRTAQTLARRLEATRLQLLDVYRDVLPLAGDEGGLP